MPDRIQILRTSQDVRCGLCEIVEEAVGQGISFADAEVKERDIRRFIASGLEGRGDGKMPLCAHHEPLVIDHLPRGVNYAVANVNDIKGFIYRGEVPPMPKGEPPAAPAGVPAEQAQAEAEAIARASE